MNYKTLLIALLLLSTALSAQRKSILEITPTAGPSIRLLDRNLYPDQPINTGLAAGLRADLRLGKWVGLAANIQYDNFSLKESLRAYYQPLTLQNLPYRADIVRTRATSTGLMLNFGNYNIRRRQQFGVAVGGGMQQATYQNRIALFDLPFAADSTVFDKSYTSTNAYAQAGLAYTWYFNKNLGIHLGFNTRYLLNRNALLRRDIPNAGSLPDAAAVLALPLDQVADNSRWIFTPSLGLRYSIGKRLPDKTPQPQQLVEDVKNKAKKEKQRWQFTPSVGAPIRMLNKDIFATNSLNVGQQLSLKWEKPLRGKWISGPELQFGHYNLEGNIRDNYALLLDQIQSSNLTQQFAPVWNLNGAWNIGVSSRSHNARHRFSGSTGVGAQFLLQKTPDNIAWGNGGTGPNGAFYTSDKPKPVQPNPFVQAHGGYEYHIRPCLAIGIGINAQYLITSPSVEYRNIPPDFNGNLDKLLATQTSQGKALNGLVITPLVSVRFLFGQCKGPGDPGDPIDPGDSAPDLCFNFAWNNQNPNDTCFTGDQFEFDITQQPFGGGQLAGYQVYLSPVNDPTNLQLVLDFSHPATHFSLNSQLLDPNQEYRLLVKLMTIGGSVACSKQSVILKRCAACSDAGLPGGRMKQKSKFKKIQKF